jgi:hypothetical protein
VNTQVYHCPYFARNPASIRRIIIDQCSKRAESRRARERTCYARILVPHNPVRFRIPARCPFCGGSGLIVPQTTITAGAVLLTWCCRSCKTEWPISAAEQESERRSGDADTRPAPRRERRLHQAFDKDGAEHQRLRVRTEQLKMEHAALSLDVEPFSKPAHDRHNEDLAQHQRDLKRHRQKTVR